MNKKLEIGDVVEGTHGKMRLIADFLPSPAAFAYTEPETEKITIVLDKGTVEFFREQAANFSVSYQRMIRELLKGYVELQEKELA
jgi:predicted DNA binding CopG/RHH family protein